MKPSAFKHVKNIEYFEFEEDFVEEGIRCIPMIVRFKLDKAGIKLKLNEWAKFNVDEKVRLALLECNEEEEIKKYNQFVSNLIRCYTNKEATVLAIDINPAWNNKVKIPSELLEKVLEFDNIINNEQWSSLTVLQRFALLKLCRSNHENKNLPIAPAPKGNAHYYSLEVLIYVFASPIKKAKMAKKYYFNTKVS